MKRIFSVLLLIILNFDLANACTTFFFQKGDQYFFGRNYDWITGSGMVIINKRGLMKSGGLSSEGKKAEWTSLYGSSTFNQYGREYPTGGMNEKGLVVELMWLDDTKYPDEDTRPGLGCLQWIQYQLDICSTVDEVIKTDHVIRISNKATPIHFLVADATGNVSVIEFLAGKISVQKKSDMPVAVLTNDTYSSSINFAEEQIRKNNTAVNSFQSNSLGRFVHACSMLNAYKTENQDVKPVDYSFRILDEVSQPGFTKWSIVYDIKKKEIHFKTAGYGETKMIKLSDFDFSCSAFPVVYNMNQPAKGDVSLKFIPYSTELNRQLITETFSAKSDQVSATKKEIDEMAVYPESVKCK